MSDLRGFVQLLRRYLRPHWKAVALLLVTCYAATALAGLLPLLMAPILDLALGAPAGEGSASGVSGLTLGNLGGTILRALGLQGLDRFHAIVVLCALYVLVGVLKGAADFGNYLLALWIRVRAGAAMQLDLFRHLLTLSLGFFDRRKSGELVARLNADTSAATHGLETVVGTLLTAPVLIAFYAYLLVRTSPTLVVAALGAAALHYGVTRVVRGPIRRLATDQFSVFAELAARLHETVANIRVVKSFAAERFEIARLAQTIRHVVRVNVRYGVYKHAEEPARSLVGYVVEASVVLLAAWELLAGRLAAPTFFLFLYVGRAVMLQLTHVNAAYIQTQSILAAASRVAELRAVAPAVADGSGTIDDFRDAIVLRDVTFGYEGGEPVLQDVSLEIRKGEIVALVGPSGTGKSTLADLILRFHDPRAGAVSVDGRDVRTLTQASYRRLFGVVPQDPVLFNASVRDNIAYSREGVSEADVRRAAGIANADAFIAEMPDGYDSVVGDRGVRLSGGQRQRVAIARAIASRPPILILDEATSSLDTESERLVQQAIDRVILGATSIIIAHRLSTVLHADKIVVLNRGRVEAVGRHAEVLQSSETYGQLFRGQFAGSENVALRSTS